VTYFHETAESIRVLGFWRTVWYKTFYRIWMRFMHRHDWCFMKPTIDGHWCQWCGMRGHRSELAKRCSPPSSPKP